MEPVIKGLIFLFVLVMLVLCTVLALVWSMPDLQKDSLSDNICLNAKGKVQCGKTDKLLQNCLAEATETEYKKAKQNDIDKQRLFMSKHGVRLMDIYEKYYWEMKPAAKLTGKDQTKIEDNVGQSLTTIREWNHGRDLYYTTGFERYGAKHRNGRIVVPVSGTYWIYSFVDLFEGFDSKAATQDNSHNIIPIQHAIYKFNILDENEIPVVSSIQPHTKSTNKYFNSFSSYISALAELKAGDELSVKVSSLSYLKYTNNNIFGVNLI